MNMAWTLLAPTMGTTTCSSTGSVFIIMRLQVTNNHQLGGGGGGEILSTKDAYFHLI